METKEIRFSIGVQDGLNPDIFWDWESADTIEEAREKLARLKSTGSKHSFSIMEETIVSTYRKVN